MSEVTIPSGPPRPLDSDKLANLLREALLATARELRGKPVEETEWLIYRKSERPQVLWEGVNLPAPLYRKSIWNIRASAAQCPEAKAFTDYLWDAGALPHTISTAGDGIPGQESWADFVWVEQVQAPFLHLCARSATKRLSEASTYEPWHVEPEEIETAAQDGAQAICLGRRSVTVLCPLWIFVPVENLAVTLGPGIHLRKWTIEERCLFLTRYHQEYLEADPSTWASGALLEVHLRQVAQDRESIVRAAISSLDLVKWALSAAADSSVAIGEGGVILRSPSGAIWPTIRRQDVRGGHSLLVDGMVTERASHLISGAQSLMSVAPALESILWFLGRSHTAATSRDSLLEAAIGMESLLVSARGELTHQFRLHGAALLSSTVKEDVDAELNQIYKLRSQAAHGTAGEKDDFVRLAPRCRFLLSQAMVAALNLVETGELRPDQTKGDLGKAVGNLVRKRCLVPLATSSSSPTTKPPNTDP
jgi:hypothetical protein